MAKRRPVARDFNRWYTRSVRPRAIIQRWDCSSAADAPLPLLRGPRVCLFHGPHGWLGNCRTQIWSASTKLLYNYQPPTPYYKMNPTTTMIVTILPLLGQVHGALQFCGRIGVEYFKEDIFALSTLVVVRDGDTLAIAILLADYRTILMSKIIEALSHWLAQRRSGRWNWFRNGRYWGTRLHLGAIGIWSGLEWSGRILQRAISAMNYHKCIACRRGRNKRFANTLTGMMRLRKSWYMKVGLRSSTTNKLQACLKGIKLWRMGKERWQGIQPTNTQSDEGPNTDSSFGTI